jgi:hypothetical protein
LQNPRTEAQNVIRLSQGGYMRGILRLGLVVLLTAALAAPGALAQGKGKGQGKAAGTPAGTPASGGQSADHGPGTTPAGYDKGKKTGWGECDVPPGKAKPAHCNEHAKAKNKDAKEAKVKTKDGKEKDKTEKAKADKAKTGKPKSEKGKGKVKT